ncbi:cell division protein FtsX [Fibrobacterota bacterium]
MRNQIGYLIMEAIRGFKDSRLSSLTAIFTIGICTSVLGFILITLWVIITTVNLQTGDNSIRIFMDQDHESAESIQQTEKALRNLTGMDSIIFVSKSEALEEFKRDFDRDMIEALPYNPLPPSFILYPGNAYASSAQSKMLRNRLKLLDGVEDISEVPTYLAWLDKWKMPVLIISLFFILFIAGALALIVSNAVKLNLFTRKVLVENMKYCGAGEAFITIPFLLEGLLLGLAGSLFGVASTAIIFVFFKLLFPDTLIGGQWKIFLVLIAFTSVLGSWASFKTVRTFIHKG